MPRRGNRDDGWSGGRWPAYVPIAQRQHKANLALAKLRKQGHSVSPVKIEGRAIATTFWGKAWCDNLERYRDYANRIERGRSYVRNGSVVDLQIATREVTAMVSGSRLYKVNVSISGVPSRQWASICKDCAGGIDSLIELLQGRFAKGLMERICRQGDGLFPKPSEIQFSCSCPDYASMCKHIAATLYGIGARLDAHPALLFRLRDVDENDLIARIDSSALTKAGPSSGKVLEPGDLDMIFGLDMVVDDTRPETASGTASTPHLGPAAKSRSSRHNTPAVKSKGRRRRKIAKVTTSATTPGVAVAANNGRERMSSAAAKQGQRRRTTSRIAATGAFLHDGRNRPT
jgi:uncharacterized Zn finger protein